MSEIMLLICDFINSRDVRSYLQEIKYQFTSPEAGFVVYWSKRPVKDKIRAWEEIIHSLPDCTAQESEDTGRLEIASFHAFLREYIELLKRDIQNFCSGEGFQYSYKVYRNGKDRVQPGWYGRDEMFFSKYHLCVEHCKKHECYENCDKIMITQIAIDRTDEERFKGNIIFNRDMEMIDAHFPHKNEYEAEIAMTFINMCFPVPTPFKRGDILIYYGINEISGDIRREENSLPDVEERLPDGENIPFVLSYIRTWNSRRCLREDLMSMNVPAQGGGMDWIKRWMGCWKGAAGMRPVGTYIRDDQGNLSCGGLLYVMYTDLEYYRKPLKGAEQQLQVYSCYEKKEIHEELLISGCFAIRINEYYREAQKDGIIYYSDEALKLIGLSADNTDSDFEKSGT